MKIRRNTLANIEQYVSFNSFDLVIFQKKRCEFKKRMNCLVLLKMKKLCISMSKDISLGTIVEHCI